MHILSKIHIVNYRSIVDMEMPLSNYTPIVGYNNAGKTNILTACKWLLRSFSFKEEDFNDPESVICITGTIKGITDEVLAKLQAGHRASIIPYVHNKSVALRKTQASPGLAASKITLEILSPESGEYVSNPAGIENAIKNLFPEPIIVGATDNIEEDVAKQKANTTIGRLISEIISPIEAKYGCTATAAMKDLKDLLDADGGARAEEILKFDEEINAKLNVLFPDVKVRLHVPTPELRDFFKQGTIKIYDEDRGIGTDISSFGSGAQRSIQIALIRQLAEVKNAQPDTTTTTLLLVDEPELYLHPQAIEQIRLALKELSEDGYQIIFSTHSALTIQAEDAANTILVRKNKELGTFRRKRLDEAINTIVNADDHENQLELLFSLGHSSQILFAESVVLSEGKTEHYILPSLYQRYNNNTTLSSEKAALVRQDGVGNTAKCMEVLHAMDIPAKAIVDLDFAFRQAVKCGLLDEDDTDLKHCRSYFQIMEKEGLCILDGGLPTKKGALNAAKSFNHMAMKAENKAAVCNLHDKLKEKNIWLWKHGVIEDHLGLEGKKSSHWSRFCTNLKSAPLETLIPDNDGIKELIAWLQQPNQ